MSAHHVHHCASHSRNRTHSRKVARPNRPAATAGSRDGVPRPRRRLTARIDPARLEAMEDLLFEAVLDYHPNRHAALDRLLADVRRADGPDGNRPAFVAPPPRLPPAPSPAWLDRIERRLVAVVLDHHPNHDRALDRLLGDLDLARVEDEREQAEFDMQCDNDPDGLG